MNLPDALSWYVPSLGTDIEFDMAIHHTQISTDKEELWQVKQRWTPNYGNWNISLWMATLRISQRCQICCRPNKATVTCWLEEVSSSEALLVPSGEREEVLYQIHYVHLAIINCQLWPCNNVYWPGMSRHRMFMLLECIIYTSASVLSRVYNQLH